jgi:hypothetical protein
MRAKNDISENEAVRAARIMDELLKPLGNSARSVGDLASAYGDIIKNDRDTRGSKPKSTTKPTSKGNSSRPRGPDGRFKKIPTPRGRE